MDGASISATGLIRNTDVFLNIKAVSIIHFFRASVGEPITNCAVTSTGMNTGYQFRIVSKAPNTVFF